MSESDAEIVRKIRELVHSPDADVRSLRTVGNARTFVVRTKEGVYFAKHGPKVPGEIRNLQRLAPIPDPAFRFSQVYAHDESSNLLILMFESGQSFLRDVIWRGNRLFAPLCKRGLFERASKIGRWLARFHDANGVQERGWEEDRRITLEYLASMRRWLSPEDRNRLVAKTEAVPPSTTPRFLTNHDFSARNCLVSDTVVAVVDWEKLLVKPAYYPLCHMAVNLEARSRSRLFSRPFCRQLGEQVVRAYADSCSWPFDFDEYRVYRKWYLIEYIYGYETKTGVFEPWTRDRPEMDRFINECVKAELRTWA